MWAVHGGHVGVQLACAVQLAQDAVDAAGAVHVFDVVLVGVGRDLDTAAAPPGHAVDVGQGEVDFASCAMARMCRMVLVEPPMAISSAMAFSNAFFADSARQHVQLFLLVIALAQFHRQATGALEQLLAVGVRGYHGAIARQR